MLYGLGRLLQVIGMIILPLAIAAQISPVNPISLGTSLAFSTIGVVVFLLGYLIQKMGKR
jgi:hypothetical protein